MMTLEQAINRLEDMVSGCYQQQFPNSELRNNTKEAVEVLKFSFMSILKLQNKKIRNDAFNTIINTVLDDTPLPKTWQKTGNTTYIEYCKSTKELNKILKYPDIVEECIECCNIINQRMNEEYTQEDLADHSLQDLNRKYYHKYFYFRNNDIGSQYVWVKKIKKNDKDNFLIDGTVIYTNGTNNSIGLYEIQDYPVENFYNFGDKNNRFTSCEDLDNALHSPIDTRLKSHVVNGKEVAEDILFIFTWFYEIHIPDLAKILKTLKFN